MAEVEEGVGDAALLPDFRPQLIAGLKASHDQVEPHDGHRSSGPVLEVETAREEGIPNPDALAEVVLDLEPGSGRDFPFRGPGPDPSVAGQGGKNSGAEAEVQEEEWSDVHDGL